MSITSRINEMSSHIEQAYDELQGLGADLTNVNKNIENISMVLDDIYDSMPQVSGEGTSLTLDDTRVGKIKSTLKGNTSQTTYSGKNLFDKSNYVDNYYISSTGELVAENGNFASYYIPVSSGNYIISGADTEKIIRCAVYDSNQTFIRRELTTVATSLAITISNDEKYVRVSGYKVDSNTFQLEKGSTATSYEPYVGGTASPNPNYPQPVNVVSGDNEIEVCGKNLLGSTLGQMKEWNTSGIWSDNKFTKNGIDITPIFVNGVLDRIELNGTCTGNFTFIVARYTRSEFLSKITVGSSYTLSGCPSGGTSTSYYLRLHELPWKNFMTDIGNSFTITMPSISENAQSMHMIIGIDSGTNVSGKVFKPMFRLSSTSDIYEPYQGNTYNIDLPVENLLNLPNNTKTSNGITSTITNGKLKIVGTTTANWFSICDLNIPLESGTYTFSYTNKKVFRYNLALRYEDNTTGTIYGNTDRNTLITLNQKATIIAMSSDSNTVGATFDYEDYLMIEKGSKQNNFTPYGTTPIELCKIGNYQDEFRKSTGRNLFNKKITPENYFYNASGERAYDSNYLYINQTIENINYNSITISFFSKIGYTKVRVCEYNSSGTFISRTLVDTNNQVVNLDNATAKIILSVNNDSNAYFNCLMINEGNTALPCEPYGVGKWYLHKEIGKVVLNGSENWNSASSVLSGTSRFYYNNDKVINSKNEQDSTIYTFSNLFLGTTFGEIYGSDTTNRYLISNYNNTSITDGRIVIRIDNTLANSVSAFKTWLGTNLPIVYYVLATPTNTEITYQPLIDQLNLLEKAMSRDSQTNISQVNNDLPFIISASALKEWQENTSLNSTLSMVNSLSLGNTLNTQENNTQPIEVDNIEPLEEEENEES